MTVERTFRGRTLAADGMLVNQVLGQKSFLLGRVRNCYSDGAAFREICVTTRYRWSSLQASTTPGNCTRVSVVCTMDDHFKGHAF